MAVWVDPDGEQFFNCPMLWITDDITGWYRDYLYSTEIGAAVPYQQQSNKWVEAWLVYRSAYSRYQQYVIEKRTKNPKGTDDLEMMGANLMKQKRGGR